MLKRCERGMTRFAHMVAYDRKLILYPGQWAEVLQQLQRARGAHCPHHWVTHPSPTDTEIYNRPYLLLREGVSQTGGHEALNKNTTVIIAFTIPVIYTRVNSKSSRRALLVLGEILWK